jgi:hypothetical protein
VGGGPDKVYKIYGKWTIKDLGMAQWLGASAPIFVLGFESSRRKFFPELVQAAILHLLLTLSLD